MSGKYIDHDEIKEVQAMRKTYKPIELEAAAKMARTADSLNEILASNGEEARVGWTVHYPESDPSYFEIILSGDPVDGEVVIRG